MMTKLTGWLLIFAVLAANYSSLFVIAGFKLNQKYIAENLCVNRARPWLHCNGQCYFMKKMRQAEEKEKKQAVQDNLSRIAVSFFQEPFSISFLQPFLPGQDNTSFFFHNYQYTNRYLTSIFRPPKSLA